jgi:hypothetical protein
MSGAIFNKTFRIKEGKTYPFRITGIVDLPDGTEHFVLTDPNRVKHLLKKKYYENYHFEIGQLITCRIDKINCNGKIYIEPCHPYYCLGKSYDFPLINVEVTKNKIKEKTAVFEDVFCNKVELPMNHFHPPLNAGEMVRLKVIRIKNGQIYLSEPGFEIENSGLKEGIEYPFTITDFINYPGNRSYFIITSDEGAKYKLRYKYYEKYGMKIGDTVYCRLTKVGKELFLEPRHPRYMINNQYDFDIIGEEIMPDYPEGERKVYILKNDFGKNIILPDYKIDTGLIINGKINCRVTDIRKAKLIMDCQK